MATKPSSNEDFAGGDHAADEAGKDASAAPPGQCRGSQSVDRHRLRFGRAAEFEATRFERPAFAGLVS
ncbi:hypothetical protein [Sphingomonas sp.]|uniref:hypothetical protein n=1 Tax=Sphingomonas sp. TaxID=28214 RepID=UPI0025D371D7|nr:hypothetical protein [Sphingomonas sp.]MBV9527329.1 hypothetical protein [Sphingomonas sp.]